jgi:hypothetical protein
VAVALGELCSQRERLLTPGALLAAGC